MPARVLVADDSRTMRKIILRSLNAAGVRTTVEASDGDEALSLFKPGEFDLVLTDSSMPGLSGVEVVRAIRRLDQFIPIIMVATEAEKDGRQEALDAGVSDYLVKPFSPEALREKMQRHGCR